MDVVSRFIKYVLRFSVYASSCSPSFHPCLPSLGGTWWNVQPNNKVPFWLLQQSSCIKRWAGFWELIAVKIRRYPARMWTYSRVSLSLQDNCFWKPGLPNLSSTRYDLLALDDAEAVYFCQPTLTSASRALSGGQSSRAFRGCACRTYSAFPDRSGQGRSHEIIRVRDLAHHLPFQLWFSFSYI